MKQALLGQLLNLGEGQKKTPTAAADITAGPPPRPRGKPRKINTNPDAPPRARDKPTKITSEAIATPDGRGRGSTTQQVVAPDGGGKGPTTPPVALQSGRGRGPTTQPVAQKNGGGRGTTYEPISASIGRGSRGEGIKIERSIRGRGRGRGIKMSKMYELFENPTSYTGNAPPNPTSSPVETNGNATLSTRSRTVGMGVFVAENGFTAYNPGLLNSRIIHSGSGQPIKSVNVAGDLGFKPRTGLR